MTPSPLTSTPPRRLLLETLLAAHKAGRLDQLLAQRRARGAPAAALVAVSAAARSGANAGRHRPRHLARAHELAADAFAQLGQTFERELTREEHLVALAERGLLVQRGKGPSTRYPLPTDP